MSAMKERWKPVVGFEGLYEVSDQGHVRNRHGRLMRPHCRKEDGYYTVPLSRAHKVKRAYLHRIVAEAFKGAAPPGHEVAHDDGDKAHNAASNLFWKTRQANADDNVRLGVTPKGETHGMSVFTADTVRLARRLKADNVSERKIARQCGVSRWTLRDMLSGRTWVHV